MGGLKIEKLLDMAGNYFFPLVLSCFLIYRIDNFLSALIISNNAFHETISLELKEIKQDILDIRLDLAERYSTRTPGL